MLASFSILPSRWYFLLEVLTNLTYILNKATIGDNLYSKLMSDGFPKTG
jgi:hypothetical protein